MRNWTRFVSTKELKKIAKLEHTDNARAFAFSVHQEVQRELTRRNKNRA